eukprot:TRINITY_DN31738_c0_g1_i1.p1 TRINITY_DN31738_c0_g1~~TRINITY_DN31738_c0_g1_i1.p1  ORF type:complete len:357 (+),score=39.28 TRINITY_DN31738_c0_g1_i1:114-1184(+)
MTLFDLLGSGKVLVTGATGYVGSWCVHEALEAGYQVVGTVRSLAHEKSAFLRDAIEGRPGPMSRAAQKRLTLVEINLLADEDAWDAIFSVGGFTHVLHTASPFFAKEPSDPNDYIVPAVQGTTSVINAAIKAGVRRVVLTSSTAVMLDPVTDEKVYTAADWSDPSTQGSYGKSKTLAERAAWHLVEGTSTELTVINPGFILGPTLYTDKNMLDSFESGSFMTRVLNRQLPFAPAHSLDICHVRDVARAHVAAMTASDAAGNRFPVVSQVCLLLDVIQIISDACPDLRIKTRPAPNCLIGVLAFCDPAARKLYPNLDKTYSVDASDTISALGIRFETVEQTLKEMVVNYRSFKTHSL